MPRRLVEKYGAAPGVSEAHGASQLPEEEAQAGDPGSEVLGTLKRSRDHISSWVVGFMFVFRWGEGVLEGGWCLFTLVFGAWAQQAALRG